MVKNGAEVVIDCELEVGTDDEEDIVADVYHRKRVFSHYHRSLLGKLMGSTATAS